VSGSNNLPSSLRKNLWLLGVGYFLQGSVFFYAVEKLFFRNEIGLDYQQIGVIGVVVVISILVFEFPSGVLADRWSRKGTMILASLALMTGSAIYAFGESFSAMVLGTVFWGLYFANQSGTAESLLYDLLNKDKQQQHYEKYLALVIGSQGFALAASSIAGGLIAASLGFREVYIYTLIPMALSIVIFLLIKEPKQHARAETNFLHAKQAFKNIISKGTMLNLLFAMIVMDILVHVTFEYYQLYYIAIDLPVYLFGFAGGLLGLMYVSGAHFAVFLRKFNKDFAYYLTAFSMLVAIVSIYFVRNVMAILVVFIILHSLQTFRVFSQRETQERLPNSERAASISLINAIARFFAIPFSLLVGYLTQQYSYFANVPLFTVLAVILIILVIPIVKNRLDIKPKFDMPHDF
jgi:MFS family permease